MDQIEKFVRSLNKEIARRIKKIFLDIMALDIKAYDIEKMKGHKNLYRLRFGKIRIVFKREDNKGHPIYIEYRGRAYKKF